MSDGVLAAESLGVASLSRGFGDGSLRPSDALAVFAARIDQRNSGVNAFLELDQAGAVILAREADERWRRGAPLSPIDGVAFGVKANIAVRGLKCHAGIGAYRDQIAAKDAECVALLRRAGAIPIGTLNMHEGALGATNDNPFFGKCRNPWNPALTPGGSSGGSAAAAAAGLCAFALGTDTMGSVRIPSAYCGIAGHKPTYGAIQRGGLIDLSPTLDHIGPHARSVEDLILVMEALAGVRSAPLDASFRVGVAMWGAAVEVERNVALEFESAARLLADMFILRPVDISGIPFGALRRRGLLISEVEGYAAHEKALVRDPDGFSKEFRGMLEWGRSQPASKIDAAYAEIRAAAAEFESILAEVDVVIMPTAPQSPFPFEADTPANQADFTAIANFAGLPATAAPATLDGAPPTSVQFIARRGADALALATAAAFESRRGKATSPPGFA